MTQVRYGATQFEPYQFILLSLVYSMVRKAYCLAIRRAHAITIGQSWEG